MLRAREALMISFRPILAKHGFTEQQWRVLRVLGEKGPADAGQVAFDACILAPSLSRIIGKLEKEKYLFLFESVERGSQKGRYSVIGLKPDLIWECKNGISKIKKSNENRN